MKDSVNVCVGSLDLAATHSVTQTLLRVQDDATKLKELIKFFDEMSNTDKVIVFVWRKNKADEVFCECAMKGILTAISHESGDQEDREQTLIDLKTGEVIYATFWNVLTMCRPYPNIRPSVKYNRCESWLQQMWQAVGWT